MNPKVLIAPLNWGIGHATRCMPVIDCFLKQGAVVTLASDGAALELLKKEYPQLSCLELPGYGIRYPKGDAMAFRMLWSSPRIVTAIRRECAFVRRLVSERHFELVISDNRYGCYAAKAYSVMLTHQVNLRCPAHLKWFESGLNRMIRKLHSRFNELWIPDFDAEPSLSGALSHPALPSAVYTGPLSRFEVMGGEAQASDLLVICSGPEPQRTIFEQLAIRELHKTGIRAVLVRGVFSGDAGPFAEKGVTIFNWMTSKQLNLFMAGATIVLSRPGYSTIMDLVKLGKKAVFIPTPGQTEQEYLAKHYLEEKLFYSEPQHDFSLVRALDRATAFTGRQLAFKPDLLEKAVASLLARVSE